MMTGILIGYRPPAGWLTPARRAPTLAAMELLAAIGTGAGVVFSIAVLMHWMLRDLRADLGGRMDQLATRMDQLATRMDQLATRMDQLATRMDRLATRMDRLATRMERLARVEGAVCGPWPGRPETADAPSS